MPGHILEYRCPKYGLVSQWLVQSIYAGSLSMQGMVEVSVIGRSPGIDRDMISHERMLVPEEMTRGLTVIAPGLQKVVVAPENPSEQAMSFSGVTAPRERLSLDLLRIAMAENRGLLRGYFISDPGSYDFKVCRELVAAGLLVEPDQPHWLAKNQTLFQVTPDGRAAVAEPGEI